MNDQDLQKIADRLNLRLMQRDGYPMDKILSALKQVRDAQEEKLRIAGNAKMTDQELQKIKEDLILTMIEIENHATVEEYQGMMDYAVDTAFKRIRDAQVNKLFMAEADAAVVNAVCNDLKEKLKTAREAMLKASNYCYEYVDGSTSCGVSMAGKILDEALDKIGGGE
jgi:hypothetical protein